MTSAPSIPFLRQPSCRLVVISQDTGLQKQLSNVLHAQDVYVLQAVDIQAGLALLTEEDGGALHSTQLLLVALHELVLQKPAIKQRIALLQGRSKLHLMAARSGPDPDTRAVQPAVVDETLHWPLDQNEVARRVRLHLAGKAAELKASFADALLACIGDAMMITDANDRILWINAPFTTLTGYTLEEIVGKNPDYMRVKNNRADVLTSLWQEVHDAGHWRGEIFSRRKSGELYAEWLSVSVLKSPDGHVDGYVSIFTDITERKIREEHLEHQALHDPLTGLPNRALLEDRFQSAISTRSAAMLALLFLDLDGFKAINDEHGHVVGDQVLIQVADRLRKTLRTSDTVARFGGDEFVCMLTDIHDEHEAAMVTQKVLDAMGEHFLLQERTFTLSCSIGVSMYPKDGILFDTLLRLADTAMYEAKKSGKAQFRRAKRTSS